MFSCLILVIFGLLEMNHCYDQDIWSRFINFLITATIFSTFETETTSGIFLINIIFFIVIEYILEVMFSFILFIAGCTIIYSDPAFN